MEGLLCACSYAIHGDDVISCGLLSLIKIVQFQSVPQVQYPVRLPFIQRETLGWGGVSNSPKLPLQVHTSNPTSCTVISKLKLHKEWLIKIVYIMR